MSRVFLLSPADCSGARATQLLSPRARFPLADALGDVFAFISGLYFRGKLTYARRFAAPPRVPHAVKGGGVHVITTNAGLREPETAVTRSAIRRFARGEIDAGNAAYRVPLERSARVLLDAIGPDCDVVLLGSVASPKYVDVLLGVFGQRLMFPEEFVGRGDMSRGGLLLRTASAGVELAYAPVHGAVLHGPRPPMLPPLAARAGRAPA